MRTRILIALLLILLPASYALAAGQFCHTTTTFSPAPGITHQAVSITDPAGQQTAIFDLSWGGILVSLKHFGVEHIASLNTTTGSQTILRTNNYTPTQGGDSQNRGSTTVGVACRSNQLWITSGMTDYSNNAGLSTAYVFRNSQWYFDHYSAPYTVSTYAYFVPNPLGTPAYYLRLDTTISNIDPIVSSFFTHDQQTAVPSNYAWYQIAPSSCTDATPCSSGTSYLAAGYYTTSAYTNGLAIATTPYAQWYPDTGGVSAAAEYQPTHRVLHLKKASWRALPLTGRTHSTTLMVGSWANASNYASRACTFTVSLPAVDIINQPGMTESLSVTAPAGCSWQATTENASMITFLSATSGSGNGTITYRVEPNYTGQIRQGHVFIAGREFPFFQRP